jgi:hypothetical protein
MAHGLRGRRMNKVLENPFYYLENFQRVLDWISERYSDLLSSEELDFIERFGTLPQPAQALLVRMVMRKGALFRASKLNYAEIGNPVEAARALLPTGWISHDPVLHIDQAFDLLSKPEIISTFQLSGAVRQARKAEQLEVLREQYANARPFSAWHSDPAESLFQLDIQPLCDRLRLIFFGNSHQDWLEFVLSDLGIYTYEKVEFSALSRGFRSRRDIDDYLLLQHCKDRFFNGEASEDELLALPDLNFDNAWLNSRRDRLVFQVAQHVEKLKDWPGALQLYARCSYPGARARLIRVLEKDEQAAKAYELATAAMAEPESDAEQQQLLRMLPRLARKLGQPATRAAAAAIVARQDLQLPFPVQEWSVEEVVRRHLHRGDAPAFYVENALINALFGLLCWEAIFAAIPGAFFHPFHHGPADLHSVDFHQRRQAEFAACMAQLDDERYLATIRRHLAAKRGIQSPFVAWDWLPDSLVELALHCIPPEHLKKWFARILLDIKDNRSGFPDLIQFWPAERRYQMIEVKGPGDRLQDSQLRWIDYCTEHGMPVSVCYLQWQDVSASGP